MDCLLIQIRLRPNLIPLGGVSRTYKVYIEHGKHDGKATESEIQNIIASVIATMVVPGTDPL